MADLGVGMFCSFLSAEHRTAILEDSITIEDLKLLYPNNVQDIDDQSAPQPSKASASDPHTRVIYLNAFYAEDNEVPRAELWISSHPTYPAMHLTYDEGTDKFCYASSQNFNVVPEVGTPIDDLSQFLYDNGYVNYSPV